MFSFQLIKSPDHDGYWIMLQLLQQIGGTILPSETLYPSHHKADLADVFLRDSGSPVPQTVPWTTLLPSDSALNSLFSARPTASSTDVCAMTAQEESQPEAARPNLTRANTHLSSFLTAIKKILHNLT